MRVPTSTYRIQFGQGFGFEDARRVVPYLRDLGVGDVYASPIMASRPGTTGYHVTDPTTIAPDLGGRDGFEALTGELRDRDMGLVLDIVPNHMAACSENPWWMDVLRHGRRSRYASFFDIDWDRHGGRVLVPVLGAPLEDVLARGELTLDREGRDPVLRYRERVLPLDPASPTAGWIEAILGPQHYLLAYWRVAAGEINYRRFFDVSGLVAVRQEDPEVFDATHGLVLELVRNGHVTGLRVDHVDGLRDPLGYLRRLRAGVGEDVPIYVEKILGPGEELSAEWPVQGTTGYELSAALSDVFVDPEGWHELRAVATERTGRGDAFEDIVAEKKRQVMLELFPGQVRALVERLEEIGGPGSSDPRALRDALVEVTARLPVYRTYVRESSLGATDRRVLQRAVRAANRRLRADARSALRSLLDVLLLERGGSAGLEFVLHWQQLTGPVAAKGVEDTALFDDPVLVSRNDVGSNPGVVPGGTEAFHRLNRSRRGKWPHSLSATSTHDSKRGEDLRARIAPISERAERWREVLDRLIALTAQMKRAVDARPVPDPSEELLFLQTLLGMGPLEPGTPGRLEAYMLKAAREAKVHTSWTDPNEEHEDALRGFVRAALGPPGRALRREVDRFRRTIATAGAVNALAQTVLKIASPGVPDVYQGAERWSLGLVDPDNRRPVDFRAARAALESLPPEGAPGAGELLEAWPDGRIKLHVTRAALVVRRADPDLFARGAYVPLGGDGVRRDNVVAFARRLRRRWAVAIAPRLVVSLAGGDRFPVGAPWDGTVVRLPRGAPERWRDALTGSDRHAHGGELRLGEVFDALPVALLTPFRSREFLRNSVSEGPHRESR